MLFKLLLLLSLNFMLGLAYAQALPASDANDEVIADCQSIADGESIDNIPLGFRSNVLNFYRENPQSFNLETCPLVLRSALAFDEANRSSPAASVAGLNLNNSRIGTIEIEQVRNGHIEEEKGNCQASQLAGSSISCGNLPLNVAGESVNYSALDFLAHFSLPNFSEIPRRGCNDCANRSFEAQIQNVNRDELFNLLKDESKTSPVLRHPERYNGDRLQLLLKENMRKRIVERYAQTKSRNAFLRLTNLMERSAALNAWVPGATAQLNESCFKPQRIHVGVRSRCESRGVTDEMSRRFGAVFKDFNEEAQGANSFLQLTHFLERLQNKAQSRQSDNSCSVTRQLYVHSQYAQMHTTGHENTMRDLMKVVFKNENGNSLLFNDPEFTNMALPDGANIDFGHRLIRYIANIMQLEEAPTNSPAREIYAYFSGAENNPNSDFLHTLNLVNAPNNKQLPMFLEQLFLPYASASPLFANLMGAPVERVAQMANLGADPLAQIEMAGLDDTSRRNQIQGNLVPVLQRECDEIINDLSQAICVNNTGSLSGLNREDLTIAANEIRAEFNNNPVVNASLLGGLCQASNNEETSDAVRTRSHMSLFNTPDVAFMNKIDEGCDAPTESRDMLGFYAHQTQVCNVHNQGNTSYQEIMDHAFQCAAFNDVNDCRLMVTELGLETTINQHLMATRAASSDPIMDKLNFRRLRETSLDLSDAASVNSAIQSGAIASRTAGNDAIISNKIAAANSSRATSQADTSTSSSTSSSITSSNMGKFETSGANAAPRSLTADEERSMQNIGVSSDTIHRIEQLPAPVQEKIAQYARNVQVDRPMPRDTSDAVAKIDAMVQGAERTRLNELEREISRLKNEASHNETNQRRQATAASSARIPTIPLAPMSDNTHNAHQQSNVAPIGATSLSAGTIIAPYGRAAVIPETNESDTAVNSRGAASVNTGSGRTSSSPAGVPTLVVESGSVVQGNNASVTGESVLSVIMYIKDHASLSESDGGNWRDFYELERNANGEIVGIVAKDTGLRVAVDSFVGEVKIEWEEFMQSTEMKIIELENERARLVTQSQSYHEMLEELGQALP